VLTALGSFLLFGVQHRPEGWAKTREAFKLKTVEGEYWGQPIKK